MRSAAVFPVIALVSIAGCRPIQTQHAFIPGTGGAPADFTARWIGTPSGHAAAWITTADDGETNGRYDALHLIVDPGTPEDVETSVLPYLAANGLPKGSPIAYVVVTDGNARSLAGAARLAREYKVGRIAAPPSVDPVGKHARGELGASLPDHLKLGPEITARRIRPDGAGGVAADALLVRFIDIRLLFLPAFEAETEAARTAADAYARAIAEVLEVQGGHPTILSLRTSLTPETLGHFDPEVIVGLPHDDQKSGSSPAPDAVVRRPMHFADPAAGSVIQLITAGSEARMPGTNRSRYGHWISSQGDASAAELETGPAGPLMVSITLPGQDAGWFLLDTKAPLSYLVRPRYEKIPGAALQKSHGGHTHGGGALGLQVPEVSLGKGVSVHNWHVLPVEPFQIKGREMAGVIGFDLLQSFRLTWSPSLRRITWAPNFVALRAKLGPAETTAKGWDVPMDRSPSGPLILASLDGVPKSLIVDLTSEETAIYLKPDDFKKVAASANRERWAFSVEDDISEAAWKKVDVKAGPLPIKDLNLFGAHFPDTVALAVDQPLESEVLGLDFLGSFETVSLDFRRRSMELTR